MSLSAARRQTAVGIMMILMGVFALSLSDALVKFLSPSIPLCEILLLRSLHVIPVLVAMLILRAESGVLRPRSLFWVSLRSVLLAAMWIIYYVALSALPLPVAGVGIYTAPLFIALLSTTMTDEPVGKRRWFALVTGFGGIVLALRPNPGAFSPIILLPIVAAFAYALAMIITRHQCREERPLVLALGLNIAMLIAGIALSIAFAWLPVSAWNIHDPFFLGQMQQQTMRIWMLMSVLALLIIVANTSVARAYQSAPAPLIAALDYSYLGFVLGWSWLFFADIPDAATLAGMAFIAIAGWFVI